MSKVKDTCLWCFKPIENNRTQLLYHKECRMQKTAEGSKRRESLNNFRREIPTHHSTEKEEYFWSLVKPKPVRKNRSCLRCQVVFNSSGSGNRHCSKCMTTVNRTHRGFGL